MELFYSLLLKGLLALKPLTPSFAGTALNFLIRHYSIVVRGARRLTLKTTIATMLASILIGLGTAYVVKAGYRYHGKEAPEDVITAALFTGSAGGLELLLWLVGQAVIITKIWEKKLDGQGKSKRN